MQLLPGFTRAPSAPPPPPPPPTRQDPEIAAARERQKQIELKRKGRKSTILTSGRGVQGGLGTTRPQARAAQLLGE